MTKWRAKEAAKVAQTLRKTGATKNLEDAARRVDNPTGLIPESPSITVSSIEEEYRHIAQERCSCGGGMVPTGQALRSSASGRFDVIDTACEKCGSVRQFTFLLGRVKTTLKLHPFLLERCFHLYQKQSKSPHKTKEELERLILAHMTGYLGDETQHSERYGPLANDLSLGKMSQEVEQIFERAVTFVAELESMGLKSGTVEGKDAGPSEFSMRTFGELDRIEKELALAEGKPSGDD